jgi:hypothetical protein
MPAGMDYLARNVIVMAGQHTITTDGALAIADGTVVLSEEGDGPTMEREIAGVPVADARVVAKPAIGLGASLVLQLGEATFKVLPEATYVGKTWSTIGRVKRARESVAAFEQALARARDA